MPQCHTCGRFDQGQNNFCRFCGANYFQTEEAKSFEEQPPRPYVWKTDEIDISRNKQRKTEDFNLNQPKINSPSVSNHPFQTQKLQYQKPYGIAQKYSCPRCQTDALPHIEKKISNAGWIVFAVMLFTPLLPLCWIGFFIKEEVRICPACNWNV